MGIKPGPPALQNGQIWADVAVCPRTDSIGQSRLFRDWKLIGRQNVLLVPGVFPSWPPFWGTGVKNLVECFLDHWTCLCRKSDNNQVSLFGFKKCKEQKKKWQPTLIKTQKTPRKAINSKMHHPDQSLLQTSLSNTTKGDVLCAQITPNPSKCTSAQHKAAEFPLVKSCNKNWIQAEMQSTERLFLVGRRDCLSIFCPANNDQFPSSLKFLTGADENISLMGCGSGVLRSSRFVPPTLLLLWSVLRFFLITLKFSKNMHLSFSLAHPTGQGLADQPNGLEKVLTGVFTDPCSGTQTRNEQSPFYLYGDQRAGVERSDCPSKKFSQVVSKIEKKTTSCCPQHISTKKNKVAKGQVGFGKPLKTTRSEATKTYNADLQVGPGWSEQTIPSKTSVNFELSITFNTWFHFLCNSFKFAVNSDLTYSD